MFIIITHLDMDSIINNNLLWRKSIMNISRDRLKLNQQTAFNKHKKGINARIPSYTKYFTARTCYEFSQFIKKVGWRSEPPQNIDRVEFNTHDILIYRKDDTYIRAEDFESAREMFKWVEGYVKCMTDYEIRNAMEKL